MGVAEFIMIGTKAHAQRERSLESLKRHLIEKHFRHEANELKIRQYRESLLFMM